MIVRLAYDTSLKARPSSTPPGAAIPAEAVQPPEPGVDSAASRVQTHHRGAGESKLKPAGHSARAQALCSQTGKSSGFGLLSQHQNDD